MASLPAVRQALLEFQRGFGNAHGAVLDGRDIGTVIFPQAGIKLFVTASVQARAERRHLEFLGRGEVIPLAEVIAEVAARDEADRSRATAPLIPASDAILFDTTGMDADTAFVRALELIRSKSL